MFRVIIVFLFLLPLSGLAQSYIGKTKMKVKLELDKKNQVSDTMSAVITETDSTLIMKVRGKGITEADYIYSFDKSGKCNAEKTITWCDSCHEKLLQPLLADKKYKWTKINMNQYISEFEAGIFVEIQMNGETWSFTIFSTNLSREMYDFLLETNN